jgi:predicted CopG family antitoxin
MNTLKNKSMPTEKILVTLETKQELFLMKQPGERFGDVVARLVQESKRNDDLSFLKNRANTGDFVNLDSDEEYKQIREKVRNTEARD